LIQNAFCNAHARRKFVESVDGGSQEAEFFIGQYQAIYGLEKQGLEGSEEDLLEARANMVPIFEMMRLRAEKCLQEQSSKSSIGRAASYFLKNLSGLTLFINDPSVPIDNNLQERQLRNPVIGRKTWYGTHSKQGAKTAAVLFTIVESCKLSKVNPRQYLPALVKTLHQGKPVFTPKNFAN